ncbi:helix-turn-helix domain-containing protein [Kitasatospora viridis]|uniref:AraC-like DNA-binding protein n=1 Tax=Kitasatospora viridis TaxID=281105 RepID=A0A561UQB7_9ACTN|nr:AraC family transcriptional regulator [Kitasatospora viridis]TWG01555.1 AraC-like DNA-binding protein [Kitasatospora viridis]
MVRSGQREVVDIAYENPDRAPADLEVLDFGELCRRLRPSVARRPSRLDFHQLLLVRGGEGTAMVDFVTHPCGPGTLLHLRPGQVQRLPYGADGRPARLDAVLVLFTPGFPPQLPATADLLAGFGSSAWHLTDTQFRTFDLAVGELAAEYRELCQAPELTATLLRQLLAALLVRTARLPDPDRPGPDRPGGEAYLAFRRELEQSFARTRSVADYAGRLGYSPRTLTRACLAATGRTAKQLADARVALQAQRLLAHTDLPVAAIGRSLGFTEATNFGKFFARETGRTPGDFRRDQQG